MYGQFEDNVGTLEGSLLAMALHLAQDAPGAQMLLDEGAIVQGQMLEEQNLSCDVKAAALKEHSLLLSRLVTSIKNAHTVFQVFTQRPLALQSMSVAVPQTPLASFAHVVDVFTLHYPDRLHQSNRSVAEELTKIAEAKSQASECVQLNKYIGSLAFFQGLKEYRFWSEHEEKSHSD
ncbi:TPA: hypothetical protein ACH3X2_014147 [Trebouxia sp. C0005]